MKKQMNQLISVFFTLLFASCGGAINLHDEATVPTAAVTANYPGAQEPAARFIFHKDNFTDLSDFTTSKQTSFSCLGDVVKTYYSNGDDYNGIPILFPLAATNDSFAPTTKPAFVKNVSVDMTNTYFPLSRASPLVVQTDSCSLRAFGASAAPAPCADFDEAPPPAPTPYAVLNGAGVVLGFAGFPGTAGSIDGVGTSARFNTPMGVAVDSFGNIYVADAVNSTIREISSSGSVVTIAGTAGMTGTLNGMGAAAQFNTPTGVALDSSGNVFVTDSLNSTIRKIDTFGNVTTFAGSAGAPGFIDGAGAIARFNSPSGIAIGSNGMIYVADTNNSTIRKITPAGAVTTIAGTPLTPGSVDGTGGAALFNNPSGVAVDLLGNIYVADRGNSTIRQITPLSVVTTLAGSPGLTGATDAAGSLARFNFPTGVAVDAAQNIYVADRGNSVIREISSGVVTTLAGLPLSPGTVNATGSAARFNGANGITLGSTGLMYVADTFNATIRQINIPPIPATIPYYGSKYYHVRDDWCANQGPITTAGVEASKAYVGGVNIDLDRSQLGQAEDLLLVMTYQALNKNSSWPGTQGLMDETILKVNLVGTALGLQNLLSAAQPRSTFSYNQSQMPVYLKEIATLYDPFSSLRTEQIYIPLSGNALIDRIRIERVRGSYHLYQIDLYRLGNRSN